MPQHSLNGVQLVHAKLAIERVGVKQEIVAQTEGITDDQIRAAFSLMGGLALRSDQSSRVLAFVDGYAVGVHYQATTDETGRAYMPGHFVVVKQTDFASMKHMLALWLQDTLYLPAPATYSTISTLPPYEMMIHDSWSDNPTELSNLFTRVLDDYFRGNRALFKQVINIILHGKHPIAFRGQYPPAVIADICLALSWVLPEEIRKKLSFTTYSADGCEIATPANTINIRFAPEADNAINQSALVFLDKERVTESLPNHPLLAPIEALLNMDKTHFAHALLRIHVPSDDAIDVATDPRREIALQSLEENKDNSKDEITTVKFEKEGIEVFEEGGDTSKTPDSETKTASAPEQPLATSNPNAPLPSQPPQSESTHTAPDVDGGVSPEPNESSQKSEVEQSPPLKNSDGEKSPKSRKPTYRIPNMIDRVVVNEILEHTQAENRIILLNDWRVLVNILVAIEAQDAIEDGQKRVLAEELIQYMGKQHGSQQSQTVVAIREINRETKKEESPSEIGSHIEEIGQLKVLYPVAMREYLTLLVKKFAPDYLAHLLNNSVIRDKIIKRNPHLTREGLAFLEQLKHEFDVTATYQTP